MLSRLEAEHDNLRAALAWLDEAGEHRAALRLAGRLGHFWLWHGHLSEGRRWLTRALAKRDGASRAEIGAALHWAGTLAEYPRGLRARRCPARGGPGHPAGPGRPGRRHGHLGGCSPLEPSTAATRSGAVALYDEALRVARELGDQTRIAYTLGNLCDAAYRRGDLTAAAALADEALALYRTLGDRFFIAFANFNVAQVALARGHLADAATLYEQILGEVRRFGVKLLVADALAGLAGVAAAGGQPEQAARLLGATQALCEAMALPVLPHHGQHKRAIAATRAALAERVFQAAWEAGRGLTADEAVAEARAVAAAVQERRDVAAPGPHDTPWVCLRGSTRSCGCSWLAAPMPRSPRPSSSARARPPPMSATSTPSWASARGPRPSPSPTGTTWSDSLRPLAPARLPAVRIAGQPRSGITSARYVACGMCQARSSRMIAPWTARIAATHQREDASMDPYDLIAGYSASEARRQDVHDTIRDWRYLAAHKVAADEHYERLIAEAAQSRLLAADGVVSGWSATLYSATRQRVGEALVAVGTRLQGMGPAARTAASTARSSAPS